MEINFTKIFLFLIFINSCNRIGSENEIKSINWELVCEQVDSSNVKLTSVFSCNQDTSICFDSRILYCYRVFDQQTNLISKYKKDLNRIQKTINHTDFVIENMNGDMRFFSEDSLNLIYPISDNINFVFFNPIVNINKSKKHKLIHSEIKLHSLEVNKFDKLVRLHYIFKPDKEQVSKGYEEIQLTSNWFYLP